MTFTLALAWSAALLVMGLATARPRVISRDQIRNSAVIVIARRVTGENDLVQVERIFRGEVAEGDRLRVLNLGEQANLTGDQDLILALSPAQQDFVVTRLNGQHVPPLIYESTPDAVEEIKSILRDHL